ncbi:RapZ C-terminal domain-containing protein [Streptomyces sp. WZ-12]|uniref:RapZ C-terminal domain-containing protein n=1 Tax=Streptomyces sp. WZ-12 TaxID=3030210 RepID=UPI002380F3F2|nr:RNase adapter RapZ [Streptomyces sp. WZ-12]
MAAVEIVSFGYLHNAPPPAHLTIDLREHFRDPHVSPELRYMTAADEPVRAAVLNTPGITALVEATATAVAAFAAGPSAGVVTVADGCAGGRHRAPTFALVLAERLTAAGHRVSVRHRDLDKPVVQR